MPLLTVIDLTESSPFDQPPETRTFRSEDGAFLECVRDGEDWRLRRVISTCLADYLDPRFQPGARVDNREWIRENR